MEISFIEELSIQPEKSQVSITLVGDIFDDNKIQHAANKIKELYQKEGTECFKNLNGHFLIIIKDGINQKSYVINDRFNSIPLYFQYNCNSQQLFCANQIRSLYKKTRHLKFNTSKILLGDFKDFGNYLECFYQDIYVLKGGRYILFDHKKNDYLIKPYWDILQTYLYSSQERISNKNLDYYINTYRELLDKATNKRHNENTMGLFLSGGYDSTSMLSLLKNKDIETYSMHYAVNNLHNEADKILAMVKANQVKNTQFIFNSNYHITDEYWYNLVAITESPVIKIGRCFKSFVFHHLNKQGVVPGNNNILAGFGSDEFNGGRLNLNGNIKQSKEIFDSFITEYKHLNSLFKKIDPSINNYFKPNIGYQNDDTWGIIINNIQNRNYLNDRWEDSRLALHNGFYYSCPFLDNDLIDFVLSIPKKFHHYLFFNKKILTEGMENQLPKEFRNYAKFQSINAKENEFFEKLMISPLCKDRSFSLLKRVYEESEFVNNTLDIDHVIHNFSNTEGIPIGFNEVLKIINCGIIETSFKSEFAPAITDNIINSKSVKIIDSKDYDRKEIAKFLDLEKYEFSVKNHYSISPDVELTIKASGSDLYIIKDNELKYIIDDPDLKKIILKLDKTKSIKSILKKNAVSKKKAIPMLQDFFDNDILDFAQGHKVEGDPIAIVNDN